MDNQNDGLDGASSQPIEHHIHESYGEFEGNVDVENEFTEQNSAKSKKLTSEAWIYFDLVHVNGVQMAKCKTCKKTLSYKGSSGTSHLLKHAKKTCSSRHLNLASNQSQLKVKREIDRSTYLAVKSQRKWFLIKKYQGKN
ncbi:uncharacterized protein LOC130802602 [Amaranthus tricolor]|uniref:uncharacterized protein LOC130802602 n=1 Tax=Amaranthus tricolor TaxID=29722 RepID=UPI00258CDEE6|nr:uncharacterized protein LOC130802602 [Amaranthus tricolor]